MVFDYKDKALERVADIMEISGKLIFTDASAKQEFASGVPKRHPELLARRLKLLHVSLGEK